MIGQTDTLRWNQSLPYTERDGSIWNQGCPEGYFAQFVGPGEPDATPMPGSTATWVRCRLMATTTVDTIASESGVTTQEAIEIFTKAAEDTAGQIVAAAKFTLPWATLAVGAFVLFALMGRRR